MRLSVPREHGRAVEQLTPEVTMHRSTRAKNQPLRQFVAAALAAAALVGTLAAVPASARVFPGDGRVSLYEVLTPGTQDRIDRCPVRRLDDHLVRCDHLTGGDAVAPSWLPAL
jgi:hypothetical protein